MPHPRPMHGYEIQRYWELTRSDQWALVMALFTVLALALAVLTFRWDPDSKIGLNTLRQV